MTSLPYQHERDVAEQLAREAAQILLHYRRTGFDVELKTSAEDPVTVADREASELIVAGLREAFPDDGILSEELLDTDERLSRERVWIIDPIDGTKEYVDGTPDYCVSIGLSVNGQAMLGVVLAPEKDELFSGIVGQGVWKNGQPSGFSDRAPQDSVIAVSDSEHERELHRYPLPHMKPSGSIALKLARISAGEADATFTMSPRSEWDIAAGMALVEAAGGVYSRRNSAPIVLNSPRPELRRGFIGGRADTVAWLKDELVRLDVPEQIHGVTEQDDVWVLVPDEVRALVQPGKNLHLRQAGGSEQPGRLVAWALVQPQPGRAQLLRLEGEAFHQDILQRDLVRIYGPLEAASSGG
ncbi:3'(2'),5'-bisphosphate nucleotidase CysQ [Deinococcus sonorensis]|uniref:3'(2'),5'-bisphosphate nucleotidase CysQ n=2 Tax=Deinococcus sonorensis TaxID=309891 RepID=A0AAU7U974_9DEIO